MDVDATDQRGTKRVAESESEDVSKAKRIKVSCRVGAVELDVY